NQVVVGDAGAPGLLLVMDQPDFFFDIVILPQPSTPIFTILHVKGLEHQLWYRFAILGATGGHYIGGSILMLELKSEYVTLVFVCICFPSILISPSLSVFRGRPSVTPTHVFAVLFNSLFWPRLIEY